MATMNKQALFSAFDAYRVGEETLVQTLRKSAIDAGFTTLEDCKPAVMEWASTKYGVPLVESKSPRNRGEMVLDATHSSYAAARKAAQRLLDALGGDADAEVAAEKEKAASNKAGEAFETPAEIAALAAKLVAACRAYDLDKKGLKALAAQAVAEAFAAK
jgi:hypothetical protein